MIDAFLDGFGMDSSITNPAAHNALSVCDYVLDSTTCNTTDTLLNLTLLAEPHLFEHDNSLSRQDYKMAYANNASDNNQNFNQTIYQGVLDVIGTEDHVNFQLMNEIRLQRASDSFQNDFPGWYQLSTAVHTVEASSPWCACLCGNEHPIADLGSLDWFHLLRECASSHRLHTSSACHLLKHQIIPS